jgi:hypothetical protein
VLFLQKPYKRVFTSNNFCTRYLSRSRVKVDTHHDSIFFFARILGLVHVIVAVALVILRYRTALELTQPGERSRLDEHLLETDRLVLRTIKHVRGILVEDDALTHYVAALHSNEQRLRHVYMTKNLVPS